MCQGQSLLVATYPALHAAIGYKYGGSGANFNVPDLGGRVTAGKEAVATRLTAAVSGINGALVGSAGGAEGVVLAYGNLPSGMVTFAAYGAQAATTGSGGGALYNINAAPIGIAHQNTQPTMIMNKIIKV